MHYKGNAWKVREGVDEGERVREGATIKTWTFIDTKTLISGRSEQVFRLRVPFGHVLPLASVQKGASSRMFRLDRSVKRDCRECVCGRPKSGS